MTRGEAIEKCVKAMLRQKGQGDHNWQQHPVQLGQAESIIACLEALELFKPTN
jgi:hypothetical protein